MIGSLASNISGDTAAFWGNREITFGFERLKKVPKSTFQVLNAEKKGDVFDQSHLMRVHRERSWRWEGHVFSFNCF
jgi:hypothetical protein